MELDYDTVLDIALGGPEIGPLNLVTLHGLLRELFSKSGVSKKEITIEEEDPVFGDAYKFIQSKVNKRPRTAGGGYDKLKSRVSVIVSDYAKSPIGLQHHAEEKPKISTLLPADVEDKLKFIESELKIVKNFPTVDELRSWASEKTSPDTIVTDLWHFVSLNHRMNGAEEGISKLTELVDKLIPELKKLNDDQSRFQGQVDDLYSQLKALSDRTNRLDERISIAGDKAEENVAEIQKEINQLNEKIGECASLNDLEDFVLQDVFVEEKEKARTIAELLNEEINTKAPLSMLSTLPDNGDLKRINDEVYKLREQMDQLPRKEDLSNLDIYVKWPQLEDAITSSPGGVTAVGSRPNSGRPFSSSRQSDEFKRPASGSSSYSEENAQTSPRPPSNHSDKGRHDSSSSSNRTHRGHRSSRSLSSSSNNEKAQQELLYQPSENVIKRLNDLGMLGERQNALMDALERAREQLSLKADKSDLDGFLKDADLDEFIKAFRNLKEDVNGLQRWRDVMEDDRLMEFRNLMKMLEEQVGNVLDLIKTFDGKDKEKQRAIDALYNYIERLEENKLERDDPVFLELSKNFGLSNKDSTDGSMKSQGPSGVAELANDLDLLKSSLQELAKVVADHDKSCQKEVSTLQGDMEEKLDRSELQPLREYLENRYNILSQQQHEQQHDHQCSNAHANNKHRPTPPTSGKRHNKTTSGNNGISISQAFVQGGVDEAPFSSTLLGGNGVGGEELGCSHPHYGNGFAPHKGQAAVVKTQMKFNCLSCDRPLTMQANSAFQTVRGKPLNAYELDQLRLLQKFLKGDKLSGDLTRPCGGKHTKGGGVGGGLNYSKNSQTSSGKSMPVLEYGYDLNDLLDGEVDIEGIDGKLYKGLISQKDLKRHLRSKSANAVELRTVTPGYKTPTRHLSRPVSGKSVDFASSYNTSGLGTTHGSLDIQISH